MKKTSCIAIALLLLSFLLSGCATDRTENERPRVIVTTDGEIDDECSMVRFLLYSNEWDVEAIITTSSQYHWHGHGWAGDRWIDPYLDAYEAVYPNLLLHDPSYPSPEYLRAHYFIGNADAEGEMDRVTEGSERIVEVLLDSSDPRPVWLQAWGGIGTIARALRTIEEKYPERMEEVASKIRFFFIWEQDDTYQRYIRPHWGRYGIQTIISDQFEAIAYRWRSLLPPGMHPYFEADWTLDNIVRDNGPLCALYKCKDNGEFRSEGDSPSFMHEIVTGLRNLDHPDWGGWGGRYVRIRENTWLDKVFSDEFVYPEGRYYASNGRSVYLRSHNPEERAAYIRPISMWVPAFQNDFAARADWCVKPFKDANHQPEVRVAVSGGEPAPGQPLDISAKAGDVLTLSTAGTNDPDGDRLEIRWWYFADPSSYPGTLDILPAGKRRVRIQLPSDFLPGQTVHLVCEVTDDGTPSLTRYQRVVITGK